LMPEDYEGHPQRRDFPLGGEPVIFTRDEAKWLESRTQEGAPNGGGQAGE
jgi:NADH:ubiquinone oxidoreductase subunit C